MAENKVLTGDVREARAISAQAGPVRDDSCASAAKLRALGAVGVAVLSAGYSALYWNRFLAPSAGFTFFYLAEQMLRGRLPYRDIFFVVPPLHIFKLAALVRLFGDSIFVLRTEAAIERTILALLLYLLLSRFCSAASAMLGSFFTIIILTTDPAESLMNYNIDSAFWAVAAAVCANAWIRARSSLVVSFSAGFMGFFAALSILTKQTTGAGVIAALVITGSLIAWSSGGIRGILHFATAVLTGWLVPVVTFAVWLRKTGSLVPFVHAIFTATTAKGTLLTVLVRPVVQAPAAFILASALVYVCAGIVRLTPKRERPESYSILSIAAGALAITLGLIVLSVYSRIWWPGPASFTGTHQVININQHLQISASFLTLIMETLVIMMTITGSAFLFVRYTRQYFRRSLTERERQIWMLSAVSFAVAYMLSLSWAVYSLMAVPGLALVACLALDRLERGDRKLFSALAFLILLCVYGSGCEKLMRPFNWMYWAEPSVFEARNASRLPKLAGLRISEPTLSITETITQLVQEHTRPGDSLVVYPYFPIFYVLTDLNPPTYTFNYYIDVCPDAICSQSASIIRANPPDAIIYMTESEEELERDERVFRGGRASGSRDVAKAIEQLAGAYHRRFSHQLPGSSSVLEVYTKR